jgi:hypothetical protein
MGPVGWGLAAAGLGLGLLSSMSQNSAVKAHNEALAASARSQMGAIDNNILSTRRAFYDQTDVASRQAQAQVASLQNGQGFTSGASLDEFVATRMADTNIDQLARSAAEGDAEKQYGYQKDSIAASARAGMAQGSSPLLGAIQGGIQGLQMGIGVESAINSWQRTSQVNEALRTLEPQARLGSDMAMAQIQAIQAGIPPAAAGAGSPFVRPFLMANQLQQLQLDTARNVYGNSQIQLDISRQRYNMVNDDLLRYMR